MKKLLPLIVASVVASPFAMAHQAGDVLVRGGLAFVSPQESSDRVLTYGELEIDSNMQLGLTFSYLITDNWGVELLAATPFSHSVSVDGVGQVAKIKHLPPTLVAQYYFGDAQSAVRPYAGVGVNYTTFFDEEGRGPLNDVSLDDSWGLAAQVGIDMDVTDRLFVNGSAWIIDIDTEVNTYNASIGTLKTKVDPVVLMFGVGYRF